MGKLTDSAIKTAKATGKPYKLFDGAGLYLLVTATGCKWWRFRYHYEGKEKLISLGVYPYVSLQKARKRCFEARCLVYDKIDPSVQRKLDREEKQSAAESFEAVAREWFERNKDAWGWRTKYLYETLLNGKIFPFFDGKSLGEITPALIREFLNQNKETPSRARHALNLCQRVLSYAKSTGRVQYNAAAEDMNGILPAVKVQHRSALTDPKEFGALLAAVDASTAEKPFSRAALKLLPLVFVRPAELISAEWSEFDFERAEWRIPAAKMKMKEEHVVPLSRQALGVLDALRVFSGGGRYLFPEQRKTGKGPKEDKHISIAAIRNTLISILQAMGYNGNEQSLHGFRAVASTLLNEKGWHPDLIELQLAHRERNAVRAAYNHALRLDERRKMMQDWADYLDELQKKAGEK